MLICIFTGFASGMPLYVLFQLVPAWLKDGGVSLTEIGLFALVGIPYTWKFVWAPLMDRWIPPFLGRRRGWMLICQLALLVSIGILGSFEPAQSTWLIAWLAAAVAFFSASQDVALDAYRREILPDEELGLGNAIHVQAYRISSLVPGSLSLILADTLPWSTRVLDYRRVHGHRSGDDPCGGRARVRAAHGHRPAPGDRSHPLPNTSTGGAGGACCWCWVSCSSTR